MQLKHIVEREDADTARRGLCVDRWVPIRALAEGWCSAARTECVLLVECVTIKAAELSRNGGRDDRRRCGRCVRGDNINSVRHLATEDGCSGPAAVVSCCCRNGIVDKNPVRLSGDPALNLEVLASSGHDAIRSIDVDTPRTSHAVCSCW